MPQTHVLAANMSDGPKRMVIVSMVVAGLVAAAAICDLAIGFPFAGAQTRIMDILFIIAAGIVAYLGWDSYQDLK